mmetsp:Transcript_33714/g.47034  ORF Transcript_33714/g.47034 Transcript_33714/m.47034 type:complete len:327 (-) Transcript_33714:81-1061(-)
MWQVFEPIPSVVKALLKHEIASLTFDYRTFGESDGNPRADVDPKAHVEDWKSAIRAVSELKLFPTSKQKNHKDHTPTEEEKEILSGALRCIDANRIGSWGESFSGGHVIVVGAHQFKNVKCIVSVIGCMDIDKSQIESSLSRSQICMSVAWDWMMKMTFGWRSYLRLVGPEGTSVIASGKRNYENIKELVANSCDEREFLFRHVNQSQPVSDGMTKWINGYPAARSLDIVGYRPIDSAEKVKCPCPFIGGSLDKWAPKSLIKEASRKAKEGAYVELKGHHFDFALNKNTNGEATSKAASFFKKHLQMNGASVNTEHKAKLNVGKNL